MPDTATQSYLRIIARMPDAVAKFWMTPPKA
jgi:hypothetical protein